MSIRKQLALWLWPALDQRAEMTAHGKREYNRGFVDGELHQIEAERAAAKAKAKPATPLVGSARDAAGYSAQEAAKTIREALLKLNKQTGMSATVSVGWDECNFLDSATPIAVLSNVDVSTGEVRARA